MKNIIGEQKYHGDMDKDEWDHFGLKLITRFDYGINKIDLRKAALDYGCQVKILNKILETLLRDKKIKFQLAEPEYRAFNGLYQKRNVYTAMHPAEPSAEHMTPIHSTLEKQCQALLSLIVQAGSITEIKLKNAYKAERGGLTGYDAGITRLILGKKIKRNEPTKTGKIKTIYTAI